LYWDGQPVTRDEYDAAFASMCRTDAMVKDYLSGEYQRRKDRENRSNRDSHRPWNAAVDACGACGLSLVALHSLPYGRFTKCAGVVPEVKP
jgi:hypothetical protein